MVKGRRVRKTSKLRVPMLRDARGGELWKGVLASSFIDTSNTGLSLPKHTHTHTHERERESVCVCTCVHVYVCACVHVCVCVKRKY